MNKYMPSGYTYRCKTVWHRPDRDHVCQCTYEHSWAASRHRCSCGSWVSSRSDVARCTHPNYRFITRAGTSLCELCERIHQRWHQCQVVGCTNQQPPTAAHCGAHVPEEIATVRCETCDGQGETSCTAYDCHGEFCDEGVRECPECEAQGEYVVRVHELSKIPAKTWSA